MIRVCRDAKALQEKAARKAAQAAAGGNNAGGRGGKSTKNWYGGIEICVVGNDCTSSGLGFWFSGVMSQSFEI